MSVCLIPWPRRVGYLWCNIRLEGSGVGRGRRQEEGGKRGPRGCAWLVISFSRLHAGPARTLTPHAHGAGSQARAQPPSTAALPTDPGVALLTAHYATHPLLRRCLAADTLARLPHLLAYAHVCAGQPLAALLAARWAEAQLSQLRALHAQECTVVATTAARLLVAQPSAPSLAASPASASSTFESPLFKAFAARPPAPSAAPAPAPAPTAGETFESPLFKSFTPHPPVAPPPSSAAAAGTFESSLFRNFTGPLRPPQPVPPPPAPPPPPQPAPTQQGSALAAAAGGSSDNPFQSAIFARFASPVMAARVAAALAARRDAVATSRAESVPSPTSSQASSGKPASVIPEQPVTPTLSPPPVTPPTSNAVATQASLSSASPACDPRVSLVLLRRIAAGRLTAGLLRALRRSRALADALRDPRAAGGGESESDGGTKDTKRLGRFSSLTSAAATLTSMAETLADDLRAIDVLEEPTGALAPSAPAGAATAGRESIGGCGDSDSVTALKCTQASPQLPRWAAALGATAVEAVSFAPLLPLPRAIVAEVLLGRAWALWRAVAPVALPPQSAGAAACCTVESGGPRPPMPIEGATLGTLLGALARAAELQRIWAAFLCEASSSGNAAAAGDSAGEYSRADTEMGILMHALAFAFLWRANAPSLLAVLLAAADPLATPPLLDFTGLLAHARVLYVALAHGSLQRALAGRLRGLARLRDALAEGKARSEAGHGGARGVAHILADAIGAGRPEGVALGLPGDVAVLGTLIMGADVPVAHEHTATRQEACAVEELGWYGRRKRARGRRETAARGGGRVQ